MVRCYYDAQYAHQKKRTFTPHCLI
uniref:Uncharacterized protein n=1 Tax=Arundo donax TaxID=35708 RepID=A0A0A8YRL2_ARUDO